MEAAIVKLLKDNAALAQMVGDRIAAATLPTPLARPNVVYQRLSTQSAYSNDGLELRWGMLQISGYADSYGAAKALSAAIRTALDGYRGVVSYTDASGNPQSVRIGAIFIDDESDAPAPPTTGASLNPCGSVLTIRIGFF